MSFFRGPPRRSEWRVTVEGLPRSGSWQDLKDHFRKVADVGFAEILRDGRGVVEFRTEDDMNRAIKEMDQSNIATSLFVSKITCNLLF
jgi:splicing factor, arginine/serine-rich 1